MASYNKSCIYQQFNQGHRVVYQSWWRIWTYQHGSPTKVWVLKLNGVGQCHVWQIQSW